jgi:hypothetical protein
VRHFAAVALFAAWSVLSNSCCALLYSRSEPVAYRCDRDEPRSK